MLEYRALGGLCAADGDGRELSLGGPRQRRLTAALLIDRNRVVSVDRLAEVVFEGERPGRPRRCAATWPACAGSSRTTARPPGW
jgi:DNA-binding SARP family transcriptional activator